MCISGLAAQEVNGRDFIANRLKYGHRGKGQWCILLCILSPLLAQSAAKLYCHKQDRQQNHP